MLRASSRLLFSNLEAEFINGGKRDKACVSILPPPPSQRPNEHLNPFVPTFQEAESQPQTAQLQRTTPAPSNLILLTLAAFSSPSTQTQRHFQRYLSRAHLSYYWSCGLDWEKPTSALFHCGETSDAGPAWTHIIAPYAIPTLSSPLPVCCEQNHLLALIAPTPIPSPPSLATRSHRPEEQLIQQDHVAIPTKSTSLWTGLIL